MNRRIIHWKQQQIGGPELLHHLPAIVPKALDGAVPLTATVMTLGLFVDPERLEDWLKLAHQLAQTHPARILMLSPSSERDGADRLDVDVYTAVETDRGVGRPPLLFSECIAMTLFGGIANYWIDWVQPLVRSDLPSYLWWTTAPPEGRFRWDLLSTSFQSLVIDSAAYPLQQWQPLIEAAERYQMGVMDLDWYRGVPFRHLLAEASDESEALAVLKNPEDVLVTSPNHDDWPLASSWLWLSWRLGWDIGLPPCNHPSIRVEQAEGLSHVWRFRRGRHALVVTDAADAWRLHLVKDDNVIREWQEPHQTPTLLDDLTNLLTIGRDPLYLETLRHTLLEGTHAS
ncbi:glucose-6-phosphate dehydrogenase assembly protein OpcA [Sulfobacillus harzensis]|uniref:Uncharacterized protein n=1 Tax=Sulfobacillus harzensis TaxID=2729629 RepID=A0A7Y0Q3C4_9FIRM|nr:glucose-6-phosphate dehydrogenase assembly protein OpcA [Sulfobacillus harzensis]NMP22831.1 hypothetical protein [Sulfobacillus harzensis]